MINGLDLIVAQERLADRRREALAAALRQATRAPLAPPSRPAPLRERLDRIWSGRCGPVRPLRGAGPGATQGLFDSEVWR